MSGVLQGRRREDTQFGYLPDQIQAGDYWKVVNEKGEAIQANEPSNLTGGVWMVAAPMSGGRGYGLGNLTRHTVREEEDGTISVRPGDGSSNSILIHHREEAWHGYIEHGVWKPV